MSHDEAAELYALFYDQFENKLLSVAVFYLCWMLIISYVGKFMHVSLIL